MIKVEHEGEEWDSDIPENCVFCGGVGRHWHKPTNTPMCLGCSISHSETDIPAAEYQPSITSPQSIFGLQAFKG